MKPEGVTNTLKSDKAFAGRAGVLLDFQRGERKALSSYKIFGTISVFKRLISDKLACVLASGGLKKWPRELRACSFRAQTTDRQRGQRPVIIFLRSFLVSFFPSTGKK